VIRNEESGTEQLDDDAHMDDADTANTSIATTRSTATSLSASAAPLLPTHSSALPMADATTTPTDDLTTAFVGHQPQETTVLMPNSAHSDVPLLQFTDSAVQQPPSGDVSITTNLQPQLDGLYKFPIDDVTISPFDGHSHQPRNLSTNGTSLLTDSWSGAGVGSLSQLLDDTSDSFPLSLPFQPTPSVTLAPISPTSPDLGMFQTMAAQSTTPAPIPSTVYDLGTFTMTAAQTAAVGSSTTTASVVLPSAMSSVTNSSLTLPSLETPPLTIPSSGIPSSEIPSSVAPSSESLSSAMPSLAAPSSESPPPAIPSLAALSSESPPSAMPSFVAPSSETQCSRLVAPSTVNTSSLSPPDQTMSAPSPPDHHNKENTEAVEVPTQIGNAKKRKANVNSAKPKRKRNMKDVDINTAQEKDALGGDGAAETAATRSGRKSNLPGHLKDAGYAPPKRSLRKKND
jgi:hypothetical protein